MSKFKQIFLKSSNPNLVLNPTRHRVVEKVQKHFYKKLRLFQTISDFKDILRQSPTLYKYLGKQSQSVQLFFQLKTYSKSNSKSTQAYDFDFHLLRFAHLEHLFDTRNKCKQCVKKSNLKVINDKYGTKGAENKYCPIIVIV